MEEIERRALKVGKNGVLAIPKSLRSVFRPSDEIAWFAEGDTLILKKINPPELSGIAGRAKEKPMPLKEIVEEVHRYRKEKRTR